MTRILKSSPTFTKRASSSGFALVITLAAVVLLVMVIVAMAALSTTELRSASRANDIARAENNALMAMREAVGELQKLAGPDTRVTAPAEAVAGVKGTKQLTGVWRSWEGRDNQADGLPIQPDYASKSKAGDSKGDPAASGSGRFLGWLVSSSTNASVTASDISSGSIPGLVEIQGTTVPLVGEGTVGTDASNPTFAAENEVHLKPKLIKNGAGTLTGDYAWWIQGQNSKAFVRDPALDPSGDEEWSRRIASYGRPAPSAFGFTKPEQLQRVVSLAGYDQASTSIASPEKPSTKYFHDMTASSRGLLTNTANGGWRRDLSLMAEKWNRGKGALPATGLPVYSAKPFAAEQTSSLRLRNNSTDAAIYPWVTVDNVSMSWQSLLDYASLYKQVKTNAASGEPYFDSVSTGSSDWISLQPVLARVHLAFGYSAVKAAKGELYTPQFLFKPAVTMWNPFNVAIEGPPPSLIEMYEDCFPFNLYVTVGSQPESKVNIQDLLETSGRSGVMRMSVDPSTGDDKTWKPGESRIYGKPTGNDIQVLYLEPGFTIGDSYTRALSKGSTISDGAKDAKFIYRWEHKITNGKVQANMDYYWARTKTSPDGVNLKNENVLYWMTTPAGTATEKLPLPTLVNNDETLESASNFDSPFLVVSIGLRTLMNEDASGTLNKIHTKGYMNTDPIGSSPARSGPVSAQTSPYGSAEDSPYAWEIFSPNDWKDPFMPQGDNGAAFGNDQGGFVGTSFQGSMGLNRWIVAELPTQPLLSLGELQHFDIGFRNQAPPRVANAIGNSHATPHVAKGQVSNSAISAGSYDHSYASNHVLFDDWFVSSITPEVLPFTQTVKRPIDAVYADHLSVTTPLRNQQYLPASPMSANDAQAAAAALFNTDASEKDPSKMAWHNIASKLEVEGMFNINSTSVEAWKSILMNLRGAKIPYASVGANTADAWKTKLGSASETPVSRTTVAGDPLSASDPSIASVATYVEMTDVQIEALAEEIVTQIKKRGPFLSLSEFVNRSLSSDESIAMAGAIESALIQLSKLGTSNSKNPFKDIQKAYPQQAVLPSDAAAIYKFPNAAAGDAAYGTPGWPRQADILRPLAPIISARDDTFLIRAYGDAKDRLGKVIARSWCEAVVQRKADYVDTTNEPTDYTNLSDVNKGFGRRFEIVSFRWLSKDEI